MRKFFKRFHLWLSIPSGIVITLMCLTGAVMVFQEEILQLFYPARYTVQDNLQQPLPLDVIIEKANLSLTDDTITAIQVLNDPESTYIATLSSGARSHAYINPYTAEIKGYYSYREGFFYQVMRLHRWLMFKDMATGRIVTGISTLFFVVILITGVVTWWPKKGKFKRSFFKVKWKSGGSRRLFDLHRILGVYLVLALLLLSLTGLMWSFGWYRSSVAAVFGIEQPAEGGGQGRHGGGGGRGGRGEERSVSVPSDWWQKALEVSQKEVGSYKSIRIAKNGSIIVLPDNAIHGRANDTYQFSYEKSSTEPVLRYGDKKDQSYMMTWAYVLHVGTWGGVWSKILTFLAALVGASLPITGYMLWLKKKKRRVSR